MTGDGVNVNIENVNIENVFVLPDSAHETTFKEISDFIREQREAGAITIIGEDGYPVSDEAADPSDIPTPEEEEDLDRSQTAQNVIARANILHEVAGHVTRARSLEGQQKSYSYAPSKRKEIERRHKNAVEVASLALEDACVLCEFNNNCELRGNTERWIDVHAYQENRTDKRRPKSSDVPMVESRTGFEKVLDAGVEGGKQVHCDPAERE